MNIDMIYNIDCFDGMKQIQNNSIDAIVTDPPYKYLKHKLDRDFDEDRLFNEFDRILKDDGFIVVFGRGISFYRWNLKLVELGFNFKEEVVWDKRHFASPFLALGRIHETISILTKKGKIRSVRVPYLESKGVDLERVQSDLRRIKGALKDFDKTRQIEKYLAEKTIELQYAKRSKHGLVGEKTADVPRILNVARGINEGKKETSIIAVPKEHYDFVHPTQKPVKLMERLIRLVSDEGDVIFDPFSGSGSTSLAARNIGRHYIAFEIDEGYYQNSVQRLDSSTKQIKLF